MVVVIICGRRLLTFLGSFIITGVGSGVCVWGGGVGGGGGGVGGGGGWGGNGMFVPPSFNPTFLFST